MTNAELEAHALAAGGTVRGCGTVGENRPRVQQILIPTKVVSEANQREHWAVKLKRKKDQQESTWWAIFDAGFHRGSFASAESIRVTFNRIGGRRMDSDNFAGAFKHIRDAVARWLDIDDGDERIEWVYEQNAGKGAGVFMTIERK